MYATGELSKANYEAGMPVAADEVAAVPLDSCRLGDRYVFVCKDRKIEPEAALVESLQKHKEVEVEFLDFAGTRLSTQSMETLLEAISNCPKLNTLCVANTGFTQEAIPALVRAVTALPSLSSIDLSKNPGLGHKAGKALLHLVKTTPRIITLDLDGTGMVEAVTDLIEGLLIENSMIPPSEKPAPQRPALSPDTSRPSTQPGLAVPRTPEGPLSPAPPTKVHRSGRSPKAPSNPAAARYEITSSKPMRVLVDDSRNANVKLSEEASSTHQRLVGAQATMLERTKTMWEDVKTRRAAGLGTLDIWDQKYHVPATYYGTDIHKVIAECKLDLSVKELEELGEYYKMGTPASERLKEIPAILEVAKRPDVTADRIRTLKAELKEISYIREHVEVIPSIEEIHKILNSETIDFSHVVRHVRETDDDLVRLIMMRDDWATKRKEAFADGQWEQSELHHERLLEAHEDIQKMMRLRIKTANDISGAHHLRKKIENLIAKCKTKLHYAEDDGHDVVQRSAEDIKKLLQVRQTKIQARSSIQREYEVKRQLARDRLQANEKRQDELFREVHKRIKDLEELGKRRLKEVDSYLAERERAEKDLDELDEFIVITGPWEEKLRQLNKAAQGSLDVCKYFDEYYEGMPEKFTQRADDTWEKTKNIATDETKDSFEHFRPYILDIGDMLFYKEKRMDELERNIRVQAYNLEMCDHVMDPCELQYREAKAEFESQKEQVQLKVESLRALLEQAVEKFKPQEEELLAMGFDFIHPKIEIAEKMTQQRDKLQHMKRARQQEEQMHMEGDDDDLLEQKRIVRQARIAKIQSVIPFLSFRKRAANKAAEEQAEGGQAEGGQAEGEQGFDLDITSPGAAKSPIKPESPEKETPRTPRKNLVFA